MKKRRVIIVLIVIAVLLIIVFINILIKPRQATYTKDEKDVKDLYAYMYKSRIDSLQSLDPLVRARTAVELGNIGKNAEIAIPYLVKMLNDDVLLELRRFDGEKLYQYTSPGKEAAIALGKIGGSAIDSLINALKSKPTEIRVNAINGLCESQDSCAVEPLISLLKDDNYYIRRVAISALGKIADKRVIDPLVNTMLSDTSEINRVEATQVLEKLRGQEFVQNIKEWWNKKK